MNQDLVNLGVALLIGILVGIDRERKKAREHAAGAGGIRTFALIGLTGGLCGYLAGAFASPWIVAAGAITVAGAVIAAYLLEARHDTEGHGLTSEIAAIVVFLLGVLASRGDRELAIVLGIITSAILAYKQPLHALVEKIGQDDLYAILKLLIATFIVLPILPDRTIDPYQAINPYKIWWMVILISGLSLIGYVATRWLGANRGIPLTGFFGGLASSTAVTMTLARQSREQKADSALACGIMLAWSVMFVRIIIVVAAVYPAFTATVAIRMAAMGCLTVAITAGLYLFGARAQSAQSAEMPLRNPFSLISAMKFAALFTAVLLVVKIVQQHQSSNGQYAVALLAGLTDVDAITLSLSALAKHSGQDVVAVNGITLAAISNTVSKAAFVAFAGSPGLRIRILAATAGILIAGAITIFL